MGTPRPSGLIYGLALLGPRLTAAVVDDFEALSFELTLVDLRLDVPVLRDAHLSNKKTLKQVFLC
jgi:hypothetical protein